LAVESRKTERTKADSVYKAFHKDKQAIVLEEEISEIVVDPFGDRVLTCNALGEPSLLDMALSKEYDVML
jgi:hypothetical protein